MGDKVAPDPSGEVFDKLAKSQSQSQ